MIEIVMPRLSDSMEEGTILRWLIDDGDWVSRGDELVEVETDKAAMVHNSDADGVLEIIAPEGATLAVGETIGQLLPGEPPQAGDISAANSGELQQVSEQPELHPVNEVPAAEPASQPGVPAPATAAARIQASPVARRTAEELGVDLSTLSGSGPQGRIVRGDVERAAAGQPGQPPTPQPQADPVPEVEVAQSTPQDLDGAAADEPGDEAAPPQRLETAKGEVTRIEPTKAQQVIARRMSESRATVPDFTLETDIDASRLEDLRRQLKETTTGEPTPTINDLAVRACALSLQAFPQMNGAWRDGGFEHYAAVNVGVAVSTDGGLVVPVIMNADKKDAHEIAAESRRLADRAREGTITPPELSGGTFSISNLGMFGIDRFTAVINPPQAAILAIGSVRDGAVVRDGELAPGRVMSLTLSVDHRAVYGADAARFLADLADRLSAPASLL